jgi:RNA polymerase sigma-70 factor (ECF subfamily)
MTMGTASANDNSFECVLNAWREHESELLGYLVRCLSDKHLADDLLQEVFVKALTQGHGFCSLNNPRAWLFQVARNALVDQQRLGKKAVPLPHDLVEESDDASPVDVLSECLERVLSELPDEDHEILRQCDIEGAKQQAFAEEHGLSLSAVKSRILRARRRLREVMIRNCQVRFDEIGKVCCHVPRQPDR